MPDILTPELQAIDRRLWDPTPEVVRDLTELPGDLILLGAGGKMGLSLARMAQQASEQGRPRRVMAVSRFSDPTVAKAYEDAGVEVISADLMDESQLRALPEADNVVYLVGRKFGTEDLQSLTWAVNAYLPGRVAARYPDSRIVALSSGNVYPLTPVARGGPDERHPTGPVGEYAQSCLGRERIFEHFSRENGTPMALMRLNYAIDMRYGVLHDVAVKVRAGEPIDAATGAANVIWQGDANAVILRALTTCASPPTLWNLTGPETVSIRWLADEFGRRLGVEPNIVGEEAPTALLSNAAACAAHFGYPKVSLGEMIDWTVRWLTQDGPTIDKPTQFEQRTGQF
jgi:nucleoside-diphosphate-sugar epimerase